MTKLDPVSIHCSPDHDLTGVAGDDGRGASSRCHSADPRPHAPRPHAPRGARTSGLLLAAVLLASVATDVQASPAPEARATDSDPSALSAPSDEGDADRATTECKEYRAYRKKIDVFSAVLTNLEFMKQYTISSDSGTTLYVENATVRVDGPTGGAAVTGRVRIFATGESASIPAGQVPDRYLVGTIQPKKDYLIQVDANLQKEGVTISVSGELWAERVICIR